MACFCLISLPIRFFTSEIPRIVPPVKNVVVTGDPDTQWAPTSLCKISYWAATKTKTKPKPSRLCSNHFQNVTIPFLLFTLLLHCEHSLTLCTVCTMCTMFTLEERQNIVEHSCTVCTMWSYGRERDCKISPPFLDQDSHLLQCSVSWHNVKRKRRQLRKKLSNHEKDKVSDVRQLVKVCFESSSGHHG